MRAVILCGGKGTRFREETENKPKPMIEIGARPILWHIMKTFAHFGHTDFVLCLGYKGNVVRDYFLNYETMNVDCTVTLGRAGAVEVLGDHPERGWKVTLANTGEDTMTGGRIKRVQKYAGDAPFMVTYGDGVSDIAIPDLLAFHKRHGRIGTVTGVRAPGRFGELGLDGDKVSSFTEKPLATDGFINGGFFVFEPAFFEYLTADEGCVLERDPLERLAKDGQLMMYKHTGFWQCVDTYRDYTLVSDLWQSGTAPWKTW
jgi:glucose-1-phosphate cytidylyltransferase